MNAMILACALYCLIGVFFLMVLFDAVYECTARRELSITAWQKTGSCLYAIFAFVRPAVWMSIVVLATLLLVAGGMTTILAIVLAIVGVFCYIWALFLLKATCYCLIFLFCRMVDSFKKVKMRIKNRKKSKSEA